jgi:formate hydrogenlyase transcriptional activator
MGSTSVFSPVCLDLSGLTSAHLDVRGFLRDLATRLETVIDFDFVKVIVYDPSTNKMRVEVAQGDVTPGQDGAELSVTSSASGWVWQRQEPLLISDIDQVDEERFPGLREKLRQCDARGRAYLPLTTPRQRLGVLVFGSSRPGLYQDEDLAQLQQIAAQVADAVDRAISYESLRAHQAWLQQERDRFRLLLDVSNAVSSKLDLTALLHEVFALVRRLLRHDYTSVTLYHPERGQVLVEAVDFPQGSDLITPGTIVPLEGTVVGEVFRTGRAQLVNRDGLTRERFPARVTQQLVDQGLQSLCVVPLRAHSRVLGTMTAGSLRDHHFDDADPELLTQVAHQIAIAMDNALAYREISDLKDRLRQEKLYLEREIKTQHNFEDIIGQSATLRRVLKQVETVSPTEATVLILGETGTGKELIARAIHNLSGRQDRTFVRLNCAAIPTGLLESELFGHERGAFTGAVAPKVGRLELANGGTLFLDEVGEMPLEVQPKLLRALQEKEFERLGSVRTMHADVRLIAATNRDLEQMLGEHQFRSDLYYRLNVFPIHLPPLRDRRDDIPALVRHFVDKFARVMKKPIERIRPEDMEALTTWSWPGNIRELENVIERAVILTTGPVLDVASSSFRGGSPHVAGSHVPGNHAGSHVSGRHLAGAHAVGVGSRGHGTGAVGAGGSGPDVPVPASQTLREAERDHILRALHDTQGIVGGPLGAAARLGLKRTTLQARMRKLGITRQFQ